MIPKPGATYTIKITYSGGVVSVVEGWTLEMIDRLRRSWAEITGPSTATIEILSEEGEEQIT